MIPTRTRKLVSLLVPSKSPFQIWTKKRSFATWAQNSAQNSISPRYNSSPLKYCPNLPWRNHHPLDSDLGVASDGGWLDQGKRNFPKNLGFTWVFERWIRLGEKFMMSNKNHPNCVAIRTFTFHLSSLSIQIIQRGSPVDSNHDAGCMPT